MKKIRTLGFIGTGQMGTAILKGLASSERSDDYNFQIVNRSQTHSKKTKEQVEAYCNNRAEIVISENNQSLCDASDIIFLGVRPEHMEHVLRNLDCSEKIMVSMAAGMNLSYISSLLDSSVKLIRIMPDMPVSVKKGVVSMSGNVNVDDDSFQIVRELLLPLGKIVKVEEELMGCVTGMCGSGPAYVYMFARAMASCGEENGLSSDRAKELAAATVLGAAELILNSEDSLEEMIDSMCLPQGTTLAGVQTLREGRFEETVKKGIQAAVDRNADIEVGGMKV